MRELAKLRESLIAAQVTFVKSAAFGEIGKNVTNETGSKNYYLTDNQDVDKRQIKYILNKHLIIMFM